MKLSRSDVALLVDGRGGLYTIDHLIGGLNSLGDDFSAAADLLVHGQPWLPTLRDQAVRFRRRIQPIDASRASVIDRSLAACRLLHHARPKRPPGQPTAP